VELESVHGGPASAETEPLSLEDIKKLQEEFKADPKKTAEKLRKFLDPRFTDEQLGQALDHTRQILEEPEAELESLVAASKAVELALPLNFVETFVAEKYRKNKILINPYERRFEDDNATGLAGWIIWNGLPALKGILKKEPFRWHSDKPSKFIYQLKPKDNVALRVALFADFGTGLPHSFYIAHQFAVEEYDAIFHLGDIYYTGTKQQYRDYFRKPLEQPAPGLKPVFESSKVFILPDNHESYSGFSGYFDQLDHQQSTFHQPQEGSYFCVTTPSMQFIGIDSMWHGSGRFEKKELRDWLAENLKRGRDQGKANILMSGHEPYEYGKSESTKLWREDMKSLVGDMVDMWFWGNTHYAALFPVTPEFPFAGSCIGHGGYPYGILPDKGDLPMRPLWREDQPRYGTTGIRSDRGNNGYCAFEISPKGEITLRYIDWLGNQRYSTRLVKNPTTKRYELK
jgi:hypothetical protein